MDLNAIKNATLQYMHLDDDDEDRIIIESDYHCIAAAPETILALVQTVEHYQQQPGAEEVAALAKLIRDLTGYITMTAGGKADPVRDDLLQQARALLVVIGV